MKSTIAYPIAPHQILSLTNEESDIILNLVENGANFFGLIIGVIWCLIAALILIPASGMYPMIGVILLFFIVVS